MLGGHRKGKGPLVARERAITSENKGPVASAYLRTFIRSLYPFPSYNRPAARARPVGRDRQVLSRRELNRPKGLARAIKGDYKGKDEEKEGKRCISSR